jgi:hypothetical protein
MSLVVLPNHHPVPKEKAILHHIKPKEQLQF